MKFAKVLEQKLVEEDIPEEWVGAAIQYKMLKKMINKVVEELKLLGLENNTLKLILEEPGKKIVEVDETATTATNPVIAEYSLTKAKNSDIIRPTLKITIDNSQETYTDDHITELGEQLKNKIEEMLNAGSIEEEKTIVELTESKELVLSPQPTNKESDEVDGPKKKIRKHEITIVLNADSKFFALLEEELQNLDHLKEREETKLIGEVETVTNVVKTLSSSGNVKRNDLYKWREIFRIYLDSQVYFRYNETDMASAERDADLVKKNLEEFFNRVEKLNVLEEFKNKKSLVAYKSFVEMNQHLLKVLTFQSINSEALRKILKKFDKQTLLGVRNSFPKLVSSDHIFIAGGSIAQHICYVMQSGLLQLIPQLDDYTCPICMLIAFKPIKLNCGHYFCVRCLVKMKKDDKTNCPICRFENAILMADSSNLDEDRLILMKKYFPLEVKEKLRERDKERYDEVVGPNTKCAVQ